MEYKTHSGPIQGTWFNITYEWDKDLSTEIDSLLKTFDTYFSNYDPNSMISQINDNRTNDINYLFSQMITTSSEVNKVTDGAFDITVAPIVNLWGFGWKKNEQNTIPDQASIDSILQYVGMDKINISGNKVYKSNPNITIIGNAIAQGLSTDYISQYFLDLGLQNFLVEVGGEIYCNGYNPKNERWKVGIDKPIEESGYDNRESQLIVSLHNQAIATSGNYRKFIKDGSKKYGHSIDPRTGYPAENHLLSVSVVSRTAMLSDAYATAFMVLGLEESIKVVEKFYDLEAYFIYLDEEENEQVYFSSGFNDFIYQ